MNATAEKGSISIAELAKYDGPLYAINKMNSVVSADDGQGNYLKIAPVTSDENIQPLPKAVAQSMGFQRLWRAGKVEVTTDPQIEEELRLSGERADQAEAERQSELQKNLTKSSNAGDILIGDTLNERGQAKIDNYHFGDTPPNGDYANWTQIEVDGKTAWTPVTVTR